jgi:prepilin-type N-terminal cleavage/methylation domain-containing protein
MKELHFSPSLETADRLRLVDMNRKYAGFTLIEVMIALGVAAVGMLGVMQLILSSQKGQKGVSSFSEFTEIQNLITLIGSQTPTSICGNALVSPAPGPVKVDPATVSTAAPSVIAKIVLNGNTLLDTTQPLNGWNYSLLIDKIINASTAPVYLVNLNLTATRAANTKESGNPTRSKAYTMSVQLDGTNHITDCSLIGSTGPGLGAWQAVPINAANYATTDGFVVATSGYDTDLGGFTGTGTVGCPLVTGTSNGLPNPPTPPPSLTTRFYTYGRDTNGQGTNAGSMPVKKGECWEIDSIAAGPSCRNPAWCHASVGYAYFIPLQ